MNETLIKAQSTLIAQAEEDINQSNMFLETFVQEWVHPADGTLSDLENLRSMQLVLQYRLDTQNALNQLGHLQQYLLQLLGIESKHSAEFNMERLAFALGSDDLQHILSMLNHLVDSLLRIIAQNQQKQILDRKKALEKTKNLKQIDLLIKVMSKQKSFSSKISELKIALESIGGAPQPGVVYDHIAALQGPVSRFAQALQHGLILSGGLYQQLQQKSHLQYHLADTIHKTEQILQNLHYQPEQQRLFKTALENNKIESLEARASARRLSNFFNR